MMYYYWKHGKISPSVFYSMPKGELMVVQSFYQKEIEERNEMMKTLEGNMFCPYMLNM